MGLALIKKKPHPIGSTRNSKVSPQHSGVCLTSLSFATKTELYRQKYSACMESRKYMKLLFILLFAVFFSQQAVQSRPIEFPLTTWYSSQVAGKGSVEAKLRDRGWYWVMTAGEIKRYSYVQDILEGRLSQPEGRGAIAKVVSVFTATNGLPVAMVDFGRGYVVGIYLAELSLVEILHD